VICLFRHAFSSSYSSRGTSGLIPCSGVYCTVESSSSSPKEEESLELCRRGCQRSQVGGRATQWGYASFFSYNHMILNAIVRLWPLRNTRWVMRRRHVAALKSNPDTHHRHLDRCACCTRGRAEPDRCLQQCWFGFTWTWCAPCIYTYSPVTEWHRSYHRKVASCRTD
jgi:hypothetical protein